MRALAFILLTLLSTWPLNGQEVITARRRVASGGGTASYVDSAVASQFATVTGPIAVTYTPHAAGHTLYILASVGQGTVTSLTDSAGSPTVVTSAVTWNVANGGGQYESWIETGASGSAHTVTLTLGSSPFFGILYVVEAVSSAAGNTSITSIGSSSPNPIPCGSLTTGGGSIVLGFSFIYNAGNTLGAGSGPPTFTVPTPTGTGFGFVSMEYSATTSATTYTISSGFVPSGTGDQYFCYAVEAKP